MSTPSLDTGSQFDAADAAEFAETGEPEQDPAGRITLSGQNRAGMRARALAGMLLTSGIVAVLGAVDTTSSLPHIS